ncbi:1-(5-phosphoribosyl)-5-[(5-phosphoribosylamino)methylideneamino]imidazole-4-carboxamide isomerase [Desulfovibrio sp. OttesenSCG-928-I05]|nr:1-(5-phosphoribosyl)-5-[(5-phosphoribosylamino)methylideneamino]imidazole-4-carboxamide isomerase [Desulfovibrio sp. OttesenSCG-928-I05]
MIIFPAVDIKGGKAVRLKRGRADEETVFSSDPAAMAAEWEREGARYLHVVDLDGAFAGSGVSFSIVRAIRDAISIPMQIGGGIRDYDTARRYLDAGADRIIIGTMALEAPEEYEKLCAALPGAVGVSLDAEGGRLKTKGWVADSGLTLDAALPRLLDAGTAFIIYTDIERDGMQSGVNVAALAALSAKSPVPVIAAGGVATLDDVKALYPLSQNSSFSGAISGRALYEGTLNLAEAMAWIAEQESAQ